MNHAGENLQRRLARRVGWCFRCIADRIDHHGAPKNGGCRFIYSDGVGRVFLEDGDGTTMGTRLWTLGDDDADNAWHPNKPRLCAPHGNRTGDCRPCERALRLDEIRDRIRSTVSRPTPSDQGDPQ